MKMFLPVIREQACFAKKLDFTRENRLLFEMKMIVLKSLIWVS